MAACIVILLLDPCSADPMLAQDRCVTKEKKKKMTNTADILRTKIVLDKRKKERVSCYVLWLLQ